MIINFLTSHSHLMKILYGLVLYEKRFFWIGKQWKLNVSKGVWIHCTVDPTGTVFKVWTVLFITKSVSCLPWTRYHYQVFQLHKFWSCTELSSIKNCPWKKYIHWDKNYYKNQKQFVFSKQRRLWLQLFGVSKCPEWFKRLRKFIFC